MKTFFGLLIFSLIGRAEASQKPQFESMVSGTQRDLTSIHGAGNAIWTVGDEESLHWNGLKWQSADVPEQDERGAGCPSRVFRGLWVNSKNDVWVGCTQESDGTAIAHWNGQSWTYLALNANRGVNSLWSDGPQNLFAVGGNYDSANILPIHTVAGYLGRSDGKNWLKIGADFSANGIWGTSNGSVWTLCRDTNICIDSQDELNVAPKARLHRLMYSSDVALYGIWASSPQSVWAVGDGGTVLHYDGFIWSKVTTGLNLVTNLRAVYGFDHIGGPLEIWAVGTGGAIFKYNGKAWSEVISGTRNDLNSVWIDDSARVWIVGSKGTILRSLL